MAARFSKPGQPYHGLATITPSGPRWTGEVRLVREHLADPLRWKRPRMVFVNSMSDLFHERLSNEQIAAIFGVMAAAPQHTFQVLTKRAQRMREWFAWLPHHLGICSTPALRCAWHAEGHFKRMSNNDIDPHRVFSRVPWGPTDAERCPWPLQNIWLGVSAEDQKAADERIPDLLACPAAIHWVSYEPALGPVDFTPWLPNFDATDRVASLAEGQALGALSWVVIGGESGPNARPFDVAWARDVIAQCRAGGAAPYVKQLGAVPYGHSLVHPRTGNPWNDPAEWPPEFQVQEFPKPVGVRAIEVKS